MQPLFELTLRTIREDEDDVALNAMEFWSSLCDEEVRLFMPRPSRANMRLMLVAC